MAIRRFFIGLPVASIFVIGIWLLGSVPQAMAETLNFKFFTHETKREAVPVLDAEGHSVSLSLREGVYVLESGELVWGRGVMTSDMTKGKGTFDQYYTLTFQDGSTIICRYKGTVGATTAGVSSAAKRTGEIINGTGRFQGIKGAATTSSKLLPLEKAETGPKSVGEAIFTYTLPSK